MGSLYDSLGLKSTATKEEIYQSYKKIAYKLIKEANSTELVNINGAKDILMDDYKRDFYNRYGNSQVNLLLKHEEGCFYSRYFTRFNILCLHLSLFMVLFNLSGLYYLFLVFDLNIFRFSLLIISPLFMSLTVIKDSQVLRSCKNMIEPLYNLVITLLVTSCEIWFIALYFDGFFSSFLALPLVLIGELILAINSYSFSKGQALSDRKDLLLRISKALLISLFFIPHYRLYYFTPSVIAFSYCFVNMALGILCGIPILVYTVILYFFSERTRWFVHPIIGLYIFCAFSLFLGTIRFSRSTPPITFLDIINYHESLPLFDDSKV